MEINFEDYLNEYERKEIITQIFKEQCLEKFKNDYERIFSNAAYDIVAKTVDDNFDGKMIDILKEKTIKIISDFSAYNVFKRKDAWEREDSVAYKIVNECCIEQKQLIKDRFKQLIAELDTEYLKEQIEDAALYAIREAFSEKEDKK